VYDKTVIPENPALEGDKGYLFSRSGKFLAYFSIKEGNIQIEATSIENKKPKPTKTSEEHGDTGDSKSGNPPGNDEAKEKEDTKNEDKKDEEAEDLIAFPKLHLVTSPVKTAKFNDECMKETDVYPYQYRPKLYLTNDGDCIGISCYTQSFFINETDLSTQVFSRLAKYLRKVVPKDKIKYPIDLIDISISESYVLIRERYKLISFRFDVEKKTVYDFKTMKHHIITEYEDITLEKIIVTSDIDKFILVYLFKSRRNFIIWDVKENNEYSSFMTMEGDEYKGFIHGDVTSEKERKEAIQEEERKITEMKKNKKKAENEGKDEEKPIESNRSAIGYLLFDKFYVNLETCIPNPAIQYKKYDQLFNYVVGVQITKDERFVLTKTGFVTSFSFQDIFFKQRRKDFALKEADACKYFIEKQSIISDYLQDEESLAKILKTLNKEPIYLTLILAPNKQGLTPLDISIENNSAKVVEMLLSSLENISYYKLSAAIYKQFDNLFEMDIDAFRSFLNTCYVQSEQMKLMSKLDTGGSDQVILRHSLSSILSEKFNKIFLERKKIPINAAIKEDEDRAKDSDDEDKENLEEKDEIEKESVISEFTAFDFEDEFDRNFIKEKIDLRKKVDVKLIEFDWLLTTKLGENFLQNLAETDNLAYFDVDLVKYLIEFQWQFFLPRIIAALFIPFLLHFIIFVLYGTYVLNEKHIENDKWGDWYIADLVLAISILVLQVFFIYVELHQLIFHRCNYFKSFWNLLDIASIFLNIATVILDLSEANNKDVNATA
jgi:ankyrin repeat protein